MNKPFITKRDLGIILRAMKPEASKKKRIAAIAFGVPVALAIILLFIWADSIGSMRHFLVGFLIFGIVLTVGITIEKRHILQSLPKTDTPIYLAQMKFTAEIAAAWALVALITPHFQQGLNFDRAPDKRMVRAATLNQIKKKIDAALPPDYCQANAVRMRECSALTMDIYTLGGNIYAGDESKTAETIGHITHRLQTTLRPATDSLIAAEIAYEVANLKSLDLTDSWLTRMLPVLPILSMLFGSLAISSKIAIAWHELCGKEPDERAT